MFAGSEGDSVSSAAAWPSLGRSTRPRRSGDGGRGCTQEPIVRLTEWESASLDLRVPEQELCARARSSAAREPTIAAPPYSFLLPFCALSIPLNSLFALSESSNSQGENCC
uniref:Uncharacterized protein n=1 Tax=Aegilops tauschii subsp. strangulata TaxID=200361 RepID=A0A453NTX1_AEGTS